jgi:hypothetical protein
MVEAVNISTSEHRPWRKIVLANSTPDKRLPEMRIYAWEVDYQLVKEPLLVAIERGESTLA